MATVTKTEVKKTAGNDPFAKTRIDIPEVNMDIFKCRIVGETPLIIHAMGEKKRKEMRDWSQAGENSHQGATPQGSGG